MSRKTERLLKTPKDHFLRERNYNSVSGRSLRDWDMEKIRYRWGAGICETGKIEHYTSEKKMDGEKVSPKDVQKGNSKKIKEVLNV